MKKVRSDEFAPIPDGEIAEWNRLIKKGKTLVGRRDKSIWELIVLTGEVQTKYGENRMKRFADEIDLSVKTLYTYRWLARVGVDKQFIEEWTPNLSYSMIREILRHTGRVDAPATRHFLEYAKDRKITVRAMTAYMLETVAPDQYRERVGEEMRLALMHKQEAEGFDDYIRHQLEKLVEEQPEIAEVVMKHSIVSTDDFERLKIEAGIATDEEVAMEAQAKRAADKIKRYYRHLNETKATLKEHLAYGHLNSDELRLQLQKLKEIAEDILSVEQRQIDIPADMVEIGANK